MSQLSAGGAPHGPEWLQRSLRSLRRARQSCSVAVSRSLLALGAASYSHRLSASASDAASAQSAPSKQNRFPLKAAVTAGSLAFVGDTIAQFTERQKRRHGAKEEAEKLSPCCQEKALSRAKSDFWKHDFVRALRMASYGFLLYGPGSHVWYQFLEKKLPGTSPRSLSLKVLANQVALGPCVLLVVFAWNFFWMGKAKDIPAKYKKDFAPALVDGWKFWIPASLINFGLVPLQGRVAYMSSCAIFWNFYLSSSVGRDIPVIKQAQT